MNEEGQRPPTPPEGQTGSADAPEPGNARYPQPGQNGAQQPGPGQDQQGQGGGRRRFRRQRRGGRGRRGKGGGGQHGQHPPLDAQGRIVDVENDGFEQGQGAPENAQSAEQQQAAPPPADGAPAAEGQPAPQQRPPQTQPQRHQQQRQEPAVPIEGVLDIDHRGNGRLRTAKFNFLPQQDDPDVPRHMIDRDRLRPGVYLGGQAVRRNGRLQLIKTESVEGIAPQEAAKRTAFQNLTVIDPDDRVVLETTSKELLTRVIDIVAPIGLGQRMLIVSPPKAGKTIILQRISHAITANRPEVIQMVLLVDERPEEVTDFRRTVKADVYASSADRPTDEHLHVAEMVLERAKRLVEGGKDVVILLDSITRLSRAYNKEVESSGRTLSGGVDSRALERPKRLFGAARNAEEGGSLTIIATALIDTGSRMDEVIFEEFKGTGNSEINLDRQLAEKRIFPAINIQTSGTRKEEKLFSQHEYEKVKKLRGALFALKPIEAMERLLKSLVEYRSNAEFLEAI
jgi:transcription termination factor Rho